ENDGQHPMIGSKALARPHDVVGLEQVGVSAVVLWHSGRGYSWFHDFCSFRYRRGRSVSAVMVGPVSSSVRDGKERTCQTARMPAISGCKMAAARCRQQRPKRWT